MSTSLYVAYGEHALTSDSIRILKDKDALAAITEGYIVHEIKQFTDEDHLRTWDPLIILNGELLDCSVILSGSLHFMTDPDGAYYMAFCIELSSFRDFQMYKRDYEASE